MILPFRRKVWTPDIYDSLPDQYNTLVQQAVAEYNTLPIASQGAIEETASITSVPGDSGRFRDVHVTAVFVYDAGAGSTVNPDTLRQSFHFQGTYTATTEFHPNLGTSVGFRGRYRLLGSNDGVNFQQFAPQDDTNYRAYERYSGSPWSTNPASPVYFPQFEAVVATTIENPNHLAYRYIAFFYDLTGNVSVLDDEVATTYTIGVRIESDVNPPLPPCAIPPPPKLSRSVLLVNGVGTIIVKGNP